MIDNICIDCGKEINYRSIRCRKCANSGENHPNWKGGVDINNGITLCNRCHKRFHSLFGVKNNNKEQLNWFLKNVKVNF